MAIDSLELETCCYFVHDTKFEVSERYQLVELVGQGAYGVVCAAKDEQSGEFVAIKKIENAFEYITFTKRTLRELRILRHLRHENLIDVRNIFIPGVKQDFQDIYVVSQLMETDLALILKGNQRLTAIHCKFFLYQILRGMKYVHSAKVIHRDLKPRNLLVNANSDLKICDFGLARVSFEDEEFQTCPMTEYVCTRWYRAPEVLCSWVNYSSAIDVWSIGCILAEMVARKPLFPGHNTPNQVELIITFLGSPSPDEVGQIQNEKCRRFIKKLAYTPGCRLEEVFRGLQPECIDVLRKTLQFHPGNRMSVDAAIQHDYLAELSCPEDEPTRTPLDKSEFEFERRKITMQVLREEVFLEAMAHYPSKREKYLAQQAQEGSPYDPRKYRLLHAGESQYSSDECEEEKDSPNVVLADGDNLDPEGLETD
mmetsp:Transcript_36903/g.85124  ORF Transcript_36903/g.85124 Transcript_36903/m.85124 type:complete len:425 (-) Transcript_36903:256-1530(-)